MPYIGKQLKELRLERKMTQEQLANALDLSKSAIVQYEHNKREPNFESLIKIEKFFNVSTQYLTGNSQYRRVSDDLFYNETIQASESFQNESDSTKRRIIALSNSFNYLIKNILDIDIHGEQENILKHLYPILTILQSITVGGLKNYPEMYDGNQLNKLDLYKLQEKYFQSIVSDMEIILKDIFDNRFENLYNIYCEQYPKYAGNEEYIQTLKEYEEEIRLQKTEQYGKLR